MTIDNLGWTGPRYDDYTSVAYWYQTEPKPVPFTLPEDKELIMDKKTASFWGFLRTEAGLFLL